MEPIFLKPIYKNYVWGGKKLNKLYNKGNDLEFIAESWEVSNNDKGISKIKGQASDLSKLYSNMGTRVNIFGTVCEKIEKFPLLVKLIDATENLSVQVHPDNKCRSKFGDYEKNEAWYILECEKNAKIVCGVKEATKKKIENIDEKNILEELKYVKVKKGDVIYIKSGIVHALMGGIVAYEIQQNSNSTYRLYDWNRNVPSRKLQIQKAKIAIRNKKTKVKHTDTKSNFQRLLNTKYFILERLCVDGVKRQKSKITSFVIYTVIEGRGNIVYKDKQYVLNNGDTVLIPSCLGIFYIEGKLKLLKSYIK